MSKLNEQLQHRKNVAKERLSICFECDKYSNMTTQCSECGCVMLVKTILANSSCPLNKWGPDTKEDNKNDPTSVG